MNGLCTAASSSGFIQGLWDGFTALINLIISIFFDVQMYDVCARSWWYKCMFLVGVSIWVLMINFFSVWIVAIVFVLCFVAFAIWLIFANILYILTFIAACAVIGAIYRRYFDPRRPLRQDDGSEIIPPR
jgi:small-conductance mechanosensitive channel